MKLFERLSLAERYSEPFALVTLIDIDGITPRTEGRMAVFLDGSSVGTVGGGSMERNAIEQALIALKDGKPKIIELDVKKNGRAKLHIDVPIKDRAVVIVGAGHVAKEIARLFSYISWRVFIIDSRASLADPDDFPNARLIVDDDIQSAFSKIGPLCNFAVAITNPEDGIRLLPLLEESGAFYVGMLGSRKRNFSSYKFLHSPMGLDLGGETPEEVALSVVSEIVAASNKKKGGPNSDFRKNLVIVRGAGDLATGTLVRLRKAGYNVLALECEKPTVIRRTVSFANTYYDGEMEIEGVKSVLAKDISDALNLMDRGYVPVLVDEKGEAIDVLKPEVVVDAIIAKRNLGTTLDMANLVIALGPGFTAGVDCDYIVETKRGHSLAKIISEGSAIANSGIPGVIGGYGKERVIHSPAKGVFKGVSKIGDIVQKDDIIAYVDSTPVLATIPGCIRGLLHDGLYVPEGFKIADIDPREKNAEWWTISDKARAIGGSVLEIIDEHMSKL